MTLRSWSGGEAGSVAEPVAPPPRLDPVRRTSPLPAADWATSAAWLLMAFGALLRVAQYLANRSLWADEANLALSLLNLPAGGLLYWLRHDQVTPAGFLLLERLVVVALGTSEYALRLLPLLAALAALPLFHRVARHFLEPGAALLALAIFAVLDPLVYFASELKPYSSDTAITLALYVGLVALQTRPLRLPQASLLGVLAAAAIWLSFPSVFVLAGMGFTLLISSWQRGARNRAAALLAGATLAGASFAIYYATSLRFLAANQELVQSWERKRAFAPVSAGAVEVIGWLWNTVKRFVGETLGFGVEPLAILLALVGSVVVARRNRQHLAYLLFPALFALMASVLRVYPFRARLLLFLAPVVVLLIAAGAWQLIRPSLSPGRTRVPPALSRGAGVLLLSVVLIGPVTTSVRHLFEPRAREEIRPLLTHVAAHRRPGDLLYVYYGAAAAFRYYAPRVGLAGTEVVSGVRARDDWSLYADDLEDLRGHPRVWLVFSHVYTVDGDELRFFTEHLERIGRRREALERPGAVLYLYDLKSSDPE